MSNGIKLGLDDLSDIRRTPGLNAAERISAETRLR